MGRTMSAQESSETAEFGQALSYFENSNFQASGKILSQLVKKNPTNGLYWFNLGNVYFSLKRFPQALRSYSEAEMRTQSLKPLAKLYKAKTYRNMGQPQKALQELNQIEQGEVPPNLKVALQEEKQLLQAGMSKSQHEAWRAYRQGEFEKVLAALAKDPTPSAESAMLKGLSYLKLNKPHNANDAFRDVLKLRPSASLKADALDFIRQIREGLWPEQKNWWLWFDVAGGFNSNYYESGNTSPQTSSMTSAFSLGTGYRFFDDRQWFLHLSYIGTHQNAYSIKDSQYLTHLFQLPFGYKTRQWQTSLTPTYEKQYLASDAFLTKAGASFLAEKFINSLGIGLRYDFNQSSAANSFYNYLDGDLSMARLFVNYDFGRFYINFYYSHFEEKIGDLVYSDGTLPLGDAGSGPGFFVSWDVSSIWQVSLSGSYLTKSYTRLSSPGNKKREDQQASALLNVSYFVNNDAQVYLSQEVVNNTSTLGSGDIQDKNFQKYNTLIGLRWTVAP